MKRMRDVNLPSGTYQVEEDANSDGWTANNEYLAQGESTFIVHRGVIAYALMCRLHDRINSLMEVIPDDVPVSDEIGILLHAVKDEIDVMRLKAQDIHDNECERHGRAQKFKLFEEK